MPLEFGGCLRLVDPIDCAKAQGLYGLPLRSFPGKHQRWNLPTALAKFSEQPESTPLTGQHLHIHYQEIKWTLLKLCEYFLSVGDKRQYCARVPQRGAEGTCNVWLIIGDEDAAAAQRGAHGTSRPSAACASGIDRSH